MKRPNNLITKLCLITIKLEKNKIGFTKTPKILKYFPQAFNTKKFTNSRNYFKLI